MSNLQETCLLTNGDAYLQAALDRGAKVGTRVHCQFRPIFSDLGYNKAYIIRVDATGKHYLALDMDEPRDVDTRCVK